mgnify:CR=1 FL=1
MVKLIINQKLGTLVVPGSHTHVILLVREVVVGKAPIDESQVTLLMVNHDVQGLDVSVHDAVRVGVLERLQNFEGIKSNVHRVELVVELLRLNVWDVFKDKARGLGRTVT